jgi:hypothetical protein
MADGDTPVTGRDRDAGGSRQWTAAAGDVLGRTRLAVHGALGRWDGRAVFGGVTLVYLAMYLYAVRDLLPGGFGDGVYVVPDLSLAFQRNGPLTFEAIARVDLGVVTVLVSPLNLVVGLGLAGLVGLNLAVSYLAWRQPAACGLSAGSGVLGAVPALLSGTACCGPVLLVAVGIQASAPLLAVFDVLLPVAVLLLLGSLLYVGRNVDPAAL